MSGFKGIRVAASGYTPQEAFGFNNVTGEIISYNQSYGNVVKIPPTIGGIPVTSIGNNAFYGKSNITSITIPSGVTSIGDSAFNGCAALTQIIIGGNNAIIGANNLNFGSDYYKMGGGMSGRYVLSDTTWLFLPQDIDEETSLSPAAADYFNRCKADGVPWYVAGFASIMSQPDFEFFNYRLGITPYQMIASYGGWSQSSANANYVAKAYSLFGTKDVTSSNMTDTSYMPYFSSSGTLNYISSFDYTNSANLQTLYPSSISQPFQVLSIVGSCRKLGLAQTAYIMSYTSNVVSCGKSLYSPYNMLYMLAPMQRNTSNNEFQTNSIYNAVFNGSNKKLYRNNIEVPTMTAGTIGTNAMNSIIIGNGPAKTAAQVFNGQIYVTIVFTSSLTTDQRTAINTYFSNRFGISLQA